MYISNFKHMIKEVFQIYHDSDDIENMYAKIKLLVKNQEKT